MFPTLFPFGIGGFEDKSRPTAISFKEQAQYYFNISDRAFRYHFSYIFVALNMLQRRMAHLHTSFTVKNSNFVSIARKLVAVSPDILKDLVKHLEQEKCISDLTQEQKNVLDLLKKVNTISACVPGSQASKIFARNEIRNYFVFHICFSRLIPVQPTVQYFRLCLGIKLLIYQVDSQKQSQAGREHFDSQRIRLQPLIFLSFL